MPDTDRSAPRPAGSSVTSYVCELAWLPPGRVSAGVVVEVADGRVIAARPGAVAPPRAQHLAGLVLPGMANCHSHAFHRALRGRTHGGRGSFWTWREAMYEVAANLDPDRYHAVARGVFAEMALAGFTSVGEFHYLHRQPDGSPYDDPNEIAHALIAAAREAGLRIALLDACYLDGGFARELDPVQRRFSDGDAESWAARVEELCGSYAHADDVVVGAAIHSVRAVPRTQVPTVADWAARHDAPLHAHVSEQPAENEACLAAHGLTPTELLADAGALGPRSTAVHATHLSDHDTTTLGATNSHVCLCPTTERDLADGVGPADRLLAAGATLTLGSDSHAVVDPFEEARAVELDRRLVTGERGNVPTSALLHALTHDGHGSLGFKGAGELRPGARADLVAVDLASVRTAGATFEHAAETVLFAATAADVTDVVVDGRRVVRDREHVLGDVAALLATGIAAATEIG
jgi:formiminoglutamate deiminase